MTNDAQCPSATTRVSIRWGDGAPEERTSTLVLTSPAQLFVDLRILTDADTSALRQGSSAIDWAFAGRAHRAADGASCVWAHWVDSRTDTPAAVRDAGTCEPLPDGDTLERGEMPNAAGVRERYEEVWRDDPHAGRARAAVYVCLRRADLEDLGSADGVDGGVGGVAAVDPARVCGMVVRVGAWCQGVLKENGETTAERWRLVGDGDGDGAWHCVFKSGAGTLPCALAWSAYSAESQPTRSGRWRCVEVYDGTAAAAAPERAQNEI